MSSCFHRDWHARQLGLMVALLATLACGTGRAQGVADDVPFETAASGRVYNGTTPLRLWHRTRGYGQEASDTAFGGRLAVDLADAVGFLDGQFRVSNESQFGMDLGGGFRWVNDSPLTGDPRILGVTGWYDGQETVLDNYFNQLGVSFESLGEFIDLRLNVNIPLEDQKDGDTVFITDDLSYVGNTLSQATLLQTDVALRVVDFEAAARVFDLNAWVYGGGYQMDGDGISDMGAKGGVRGYVTNDLAVDVSISDDDTFGTNTVFQIIWTPGRTGASPTSWIHTLADRMREPVYRNTYIATDQVETADGIALTGEDGQELRFVHVDITATAPGDGTFENPYAAVNSINDTGSQQGDIILVHAREAVDGPNVYTGPAVILKDEQRFLGEGGGITHQVATSELGEIDIPESFAGATGAVRPTLQNAPGAAITLTVGNEEVENFDAIEVSNFIIEGGANAIVSSAGIGAVDINNLAISNTTGNAIALTALVETLEDGTDRMRFRPVIDEVVFNNIGGDDINLDSSTSETVISEAIVISNITSTNGNGVGINLIENQRAATITNFDWNGGTTGDGALRIFEAGTQGSVTLNATAPEENIITGGQVGTAYAILLENSAATHTVTGTKINDMGGDSIVVQDGAANLNFTGEIEQSVNNASILSVTAGHTGSLTFTELTADAGVITATIGDGLQFNDADGVYTFNDLVSLTGTSAGINVIGDSDGVLTFQNAEITNTTGTAVNFNGGEANMTFTGRIEQTTQNQAILTVSSGHEGTLVFNEIDAGVGVIEASMGTGLQFDNADGAYTFNDGVELTGATAVINVIDDSEGTFTFADVDVNYSGSGSAVNIQESNVQAFTISGDITSTGATGRPVSIIDNTGGSITFNSTITATNSLGILVDGNTDTTIRFAGQTTLNTAGAAGVTLTDNENGGVRFDNVDITTTSGDGFVATNTDELTIQGTGNTITTGTGVGLNLTDVVVGSAGVTFQTVSTNGGQNGVILDNVTGGTVTINGGTIQNTLGAGIMMTNSTNLALNNVVISNAAAEGIDYNLTTDMTSRLALTGVNISGSQLEGVSMNVAVISGAATANLRIVNSNITNASDDEAVRLDTSGAGSKTVNLLVQGSTISNDSATAPAANFQAGQSTSLNANVLNNQLTNTNAAPGRPFEMASNTASSIVRLNLNGNTGSAISGDDFFLEENGGSFSVVDLATVDADNTGEVNFFPIQTDFGDDPGNIPTPP